MNTRTEHLIESYFANQLSAAEAAELRQLLAQDPEAAAEFVWQQRLAATVSKTTLANGIQNQTWKEAAKPPFRTVTMPWRRALAAAAAAAVLVVAYLFIFPPNQSLERAIASNFEIYPNKLPSNSRGGDSAEQLPQAELIASNLYDTPGKSKEAAEALGEIAAAYPDRLDYRFYQGVALLDGKEYAAAVTALQPVAESADNYKTPALYYLGLAYAGAGEKERARSALQAYLNSDDGITYRKQAQNVLNALK